MTQNRHHPESVTKETPDLIDEQIARLKDIFPEAFSEGKLDCDKLRATLGEIVDDRPERYAFTWAGKRDAIRLLQTPSRATLIPCPEESLDWEATHNIFIEGENLEVLKLLYKSYFGRVKMIYIDPPYNTGHDFIYPDDYRDPLDTYLQLTEQQDEAGNLLTSNPETSGRYHSAWLSMMYPRLFLARQLMREDGAVFVSIGEQEVHNLRLILNEIFGEENSIATLVWQKSKRGDAKLIAQIHEYVLVFAKNKAEVVNRAEWRLRKPGVDGVLTCYNTLRRQLHGDHGKITEAMRAWYAALPKSDPRRQHRHYYWSDDRGLYFADNFAGPDDGRESRPRYDIIHPVTGRPCKKPSTGWRWDEERTQQALAADPPLIHFGPDETTVPCRKTYLANTTDRPFFSVFYRDGRAGTLELEQLVGRGLLDFPKNADVLEQFISMLRDPEATVLDFFAGSCTTAHAVLNVNRQDSGHRRFVMVQLPEPTGSDDLLTIADVGMERIRSAIARMKGDGAGQLPLSDETDEDLGFRVFKLAASNYRRWEGVAQDSPSAYAEQMELFADPLVEGWNSTNVIWEVALKEGFGLNSRIQPVPSVQENTVHQVSDPDKEQSFYICLDDQLRLDNLRPLALDEETLFVCRDAALDDETAANLALQCRLKTI